MSSILKTLKKLETDTSKRDEAQLRLQKIHTKKTIYKGVKSKFHFTKFLYIVLAAVVLTIGAGFVLKLKPLKKAPTIVAKTEVKPIKPASPHEKKLPVPEVIQKDAPVRNYIEKPESVTKTVNTTSLPAKPIKKALEFAAKTENAQTKPLSTPEEKASIQYLSKQKTFTGKNVKELEQKTETERFASIPLRHTNETQLKLQAIAWSNDSESRIAVINGNVVHEGESVDSAIVVQIGEDEVIFTKGNNQWRQLFRHK